MVRNTLSFLLLALTPLAIKAQITTSTLVNTVTSLTQMTSTTTATGTPPSESSSSVPSITPLWTISGTVLLDVPSNILQPPGTNTVTPWDIAFTSPAVSDFPDVLNPLGYPTPGPWNASLDPHLVGNGSKKNINYPLSVGGIAGVVVAAALLLGVLGGIGYFYWRKNRSIKLSEAEVEGKGEIGLGGVGRAV